MIRGVLLDLAGVVFVGARPVPGAREAIHQLRDAGLALRFVSNTTRSTKMAVVRRLAELGIEAPEDEVFTPASAACDWLQRHDCSPHLLVHSALKPDFSSIPSGAGRAVVVGDAGSELDYAALNAAYRVLEEGAELLALARNRAFKDADGNMSLDAGPFVAALEYASLKKAILLGKPAPAFFETALASMGCRAGEAAMVGDDAESDVAGALEAGLAAAYLVRTGKYRDGDEERFVPRPTAVADDLAGAVEMIIRDS